MEQKSGISEGRADYKVSGGKLIRVRVVRNGDRIEKIRFSGDFFMHPEEAIERIENSLAGKTLEDAEKTIKRFFSEIEVIGAGYEDFIHTLKLAFIGKKS